MRTKLFTLSLVAVFVFSFTNVFADQKEFERGFIEGYKSILGDMVIVPICPIAPITPIGSTDFREGIKAGIDEANKSNSSSGMSGSFSNSTDPQDEFESGFNEGYKSIKGEMVIVPICPIAPITPIGSTPFREGIKAGIEAANK